MKLKKAKSSFPLGVFIAPGVLGLGIGFTFLNDFLRLTFIFAGFVGLFLYIRFKEDYTHGKSEEDASKRNYKPLNLTPILYVIFICLTVLSIFFRGSLGKLTPTIDVAYLFLYVSIVSFVGKFIGGLFTKKICLITSFVLSIVSAFFINTIYGLLIFTFSINILMPLTLDYLRKSFYKYEATSLGISAFVLIIGTYLFNSVDQNSKQIYFIVFLVLHLCILAFFFFLEVRRKKN